MDEQDLVDDDYNYTDWWVISGQNNIYMITRCGVHFNMVLNLYLNYFCDISTCCQFLLYQWLRHVICCLSEWMNDLLKMYLLAEHVYGIVTCCKWFQYTGRNVFVWHVENSYSVSCITLYSRKSVGTEQTVVVVNV
jgi:hypothetical protein